MLATLTTASVLVTLSRHVGSRECVQCYYSTEGICKQGLEAQGKSSSPYAVALSYANG